jgi:NADP-dependent 3-hydroxy acid dehydrogenase YdfG
MADQPLAGRVAAVTGASSGIGEATAVALSRAGATVALAARRRDRLEAVGERLEGLCSLHEADLTREEDARSFIEAAHSEHGGLHMLVNNAGLMLLGPVEGADLTTWRRMLDVNLWALLVCTHTALPLITASGGGDIVNISSVAGRRAVAGGAVYNLTKFGVQGFSEALRQEALHAGVRVTVVAPGHVDTELQAHNTDPVVRQGLARAREQIGEVLQPEDIADAIVYAVSRPLHVCLNDVLVRPTRQAR